MKFHAIVRQRQEALVAFVVLEIAMWMRRRTVRVEMEQVSLGVEGYEAHRQAGVKTTLVLPAIPPHDVLDAFLQIQRNRSVPNTHSASFQDEIK